MSSLPDFLPSGQHFNKVVAAMIAGISIGVSLLTNRHSLDDAYLAFQLTARISVVGYDHGFPLVTEFTRPDQRPFTLYAPLRCRDYLMTGDSVRKRKGDPHLYVIRDSADWVVITTWVQEREYYTPPLVARQTVKK